MAEAAPNTGLVSIEIPEAQFKDLIETLGPGKARQAALQALNRTIRTGRKNIANRIAEVINLKKGAINDAIVATNATYQNLSARIRISYRLAPLFDFAGTRFTKAGVSVLMRKDKGRVFFKHYFAAKVGSEAQRAAVAAGTQDHLHKAIFAREKGRDKKGKLTPGGYARRFPIKEIFGPSVLSLLGEDATTALAKEELAKLHDKLQENLASQVDRFLDRKKADRPSET